MLASEKQGEEFNRRKERGLKKGTNFSESERRILVSMFYKYSLDSYFYMLNILTEIAR